MSTSTTSLKTWPPHHGVFLGHLHEAPLCFVSWASILGLQKAFRQEWTRLMWGVRELWGPSQVLRKASHGDGSGFHQIKRIKLLGTTNKKRMGMERSLNYWKRIFFFSCFFFRKSLQQNSLLNLRLWISDMCTHFPIGFIFHTPDWFDMCFLLKQLEHITDHSHVSPCPQVAWFWNKICHQILVTTWRMGPHLVYVKEVTSQL